MDRFVNEDPNGNGEKDEIGFTLEPVAPYHVGTVTQTSPACGAFPPTMTPSW